MKRAAALWDLIPRGKLTNVSATLEQKRKKLRRFVNFYPPFLGAGVRIKEISEDAESGSLTIKLEV